MEHEKKIKWFLRSLMFFMVYMLMIGVLLVVSFFTDRYVEPMKLLLYFGNVGSFGLSFCIMKQGRYLKKRKLFWMGFVVLLINAYCIISFHIF